MSVCVVCMVVCFVAPAAVGGGHSACSAAAAAAVHLVGMYKIVGIEDGDVLDVTVEPPPARWTPCQNGENVDLSIRLPVSADATD